MSPPLSAAVLAIALVGSAFASGADPLVSDPSWTAEGDQANAYFGSAVSSAGDVNGDGFSDVIVGAYAWDDPEVAEGQALLYLGADGGLSTSAAWSAEGDFAGALFGSSVAAAGDVDGDGFGDALVGAHGYDAPELDEGRAYLFSGEGAGLGANASWTFESDQANASFGSSVASAGDVDGDGLADVLVGAPGWSDPEAGEGRAYLFLGSGTGLEATESWTAESNQAGADFGASVASAGDVDGDGHADAIIGAYGWDAPDIDEGRASIYLGSASGLETSASWTVESDQARADFGFAVAGAGDVDGDGNGDVLVGAYSGDGGQSDEGQAFLYLGSESGVSTEAAWTAESDQASAYLGFAVASAGDVDGDGFADIVLGAYLFDDEDLDEGQARLYRGASTGLESGPAWTAEGDQPQAFFGSSVASAGDVNGDGFADVAVGAYLFDDGETDEGRAFVFDGAGQTVYADADHDGYGDPAVSALSGEAPAGYVPDGTDCDDGDTAIHPGATDIPGNGVDEDCVGGDATGADTGGGGDTGAPDDGAASLGRWVPKGCDSTGGTGSLAPWLVGLLLCRRRA